MISGCRVQRGRLIRVAMIPRRWCVCYSVQRRLRRRPARLLAAPLLTTGHNAHRRSGWCGGDNLGRLLRRRLRLLRRWRLCWLARVLDPIVSTITIVLIGSIWPSCRARINYSRINDNRSGRTSARSLGSLLTAQRNTPDAFDDRKSLGLAHLDTLVVVDYTEDTVGLWQSLGGVSVGWDPEAAVAYSC